ncbi:MAG: alpha-D-ribose 1-methylphosphonate 5-triphosphate diphosphatase [Pseudomonadota bacterium]
MRPIRIRHGHCLLAGGLEAADLLLAEGQIVADAPEAGALEINARGLVVAPGLVDIHGDAFERQVMPRPGVMFPLDGAVLDTDRQLAANGITTAYHALTLSWEPGLRSVEQGTAWVDALERMAGRLTVDHRIQLRWETFAEEAIPLCERVLRGGKQPALAFNDHTSMYMRARGVPVQERPFEQSPDFQVRDITEARTRTDMAGYAKRAGLDIEDYIALIGKVWQRRPKVDGMIRHLAELARENGAAMLSHDDTQDETRNYYRGLGAAIAEFPMRVPVAEIAHARGDAIVFGAPNVVRGGSHLGSSPNAAEMVERGLCGILASDYVYPAMMAAAARLHADRRASLPDVWSRVSAGPAHALGLTDRGQVAEGKRADLVLLDWPEGQAPAVKATISGGRIAYLSGNLLN